VLTIDRGSVFSSVSVEFLHSSLTSKQRIYTANLLVVIGHRYSLFTHLYHPLPFVKPDNRAKRDDSA
jgi:hypothetical protein